MNRLKRRSRLCVGCKTYIGNTRDENQDSIVLRALQQQQKYFVVAAVGKKYSYRNNDVTFHACEKLLFYHPGGR